MRWLVWLQSLFAARLRQLTAWVRLGPFLHDPAQGLVEYGLILFMIVVVCIAIITLVGVDLSAVWYKKIVDSWPT